MQTILFRLADKVSELTEQMKGRSGIIILLNLMCVVSLQIVVELD